MGHDILEILKDVDITKNPEIKGLVFSKTNTTVLWWRCAHGHEYQTSFYSRYRSHGCKFCNKPEKDKRRRLMRVKSNGSFAQKYPELIVEWDYSKNSILPSELSPRSHISAWFRCKLGHSYKTTPQRKCRGDGCPSCYELNRGQIVRAGKLRKSGTSFAKAYSEKLPEWNYQKNSMNPDALSPHSGYMAWWKCKFGHEWQATLDNRTIRGSNCPYCTLQTSRLEIFVYCECLKLFNKVDWRYKIDGKECDVFISDLNVAIEIDGSYWHKNKLNLDLAKQNALESRGISVFRIREEGLPEIDGRVIKYKKSESNIDIFIKTLLALKDKYPKLDFSKYISEKKQLGEKEWLKILSFLPSPPIEKSLLKVNPDICLEWDFKNNYPLLPEMFTSGSEKKVYWICKLGHSWIASIKNRHRRGSNCPICNQINWKLKMGQRFIDSLGTLSEVYPKMIDEWDWKKNKELGLFPDKVSAKSSVKAWWVCQKGHSWQSEVGSRVRKRSGCPTCYRNRYKEGR